MCHTLSGNSFINIYVICQSSREQSRHRQNAHNSQAPASAPAIETTNGPIQWEAERERDEESVLGGLNLLAAGKSPFGLLMYVRMERTNGG